MGFEVAVGEVEEVMQRMLHSHQNYLVAHAQEWGSAYFAKVVEGAVGRAVELDTAAFASAGGNLTVLAAPRQREVKGRMTVESILARCQPILNRWKAEGMVGENPEVAGVCREEFERDVASLCEFVTEGIHIITVPGFVVNTERGKSRRPTQVRTRRWTQCCIKHGRKGSR